MFCAALWLFPALPSTRAAEAASDVDYPYVIRLALGATEFAAGDSIVITSLRGDRPHIELGGNYLVEGSYNLASADSADLAFYSTSRGPSGSTPVMASQHTNIMRGSGLFQLKKTLNDDGWLHVSFYVDGHSHGGDYFGEEGRESTVLRKKGWSDFSNGSLANRQDRAAASLSLSVGELTNDSNLAILAYLGQPVLAPAGLDAKYNASNLLAAFTELTKKAGLKINRLAVDESEFPFLVYGVLAGRCDFRVLENALHERKGYVYGGSVVGHTGQGGTYFALNMVPSDQYSSGQMQACSRRLMIRLQMLADAADRSE
jgi:hypothetical protein